MFASEIRNFHHNQRIANSEPQVQEKERSHIQGSTLLLNGKIFQSKRSDKIYSRLQKKTLVLWMLLKPQLLCLTVHMNSTYHKNVSQAPSLQNST